MHYQVLARKWRPQTFKEVIGQPHIVRTLKNSLLQKRIAQAYLLAGTRGVGKTTVARIFAKAIRCLSLDENANPCGECQSCVDTNTQASMDIIEIDGASHNGVESIRTLIDNVQYLPTSGEYKVYIIDEVHMLSVSAFNALLKTLEEPPAHVIFIFATTDPDKLLKTVLSRCQRLDFRNVQDQDLIDHVNEIATKEEISFENETLLRDLASLGKGSVRDTLSLLDQLLSMSEGRSISEEVFSLALGVAKESQVMGIMEAICHADSDKVNAIFDEVFKNNVDLKSFCSQISHQFFMMTQSEKMQDQYSVAKDEAFWIFEVFNKEMTWALESLHPKEIALVVFQKICLRGEFFFSNASKKKVIVEPKVKKEELIQIVEDIKEIVEETPIPIISKEKFTWHGFLKYLESQSLAIAQNLKRSLVLNEEDFVKELKVLKIAYTEGDEVLHDYISQKETNEKLDVALKDYCSNKTVSIKFSFIDEKEKQEINIVSIEEKEEIEQENIKKAKEQNILDNQYIQEAQKLFDTKVDKIIIKD